MKIGERDHLNRVLKMIAGMLVLVRSRQAHNAAVCDTEGCNWMLTANNAMGVGARHAAAHRHRVVVTREVVTEYDGSTPDEHPNMGT